MLLGILLTLLIIDCVAMTGIILLQRSEGGALGMGGGGGGNFMSARGTGDLLTRTTQILAIIFFVLSLTITLLAGRSNQSSLIDESKVKGLETEELIRAPAPPPGPPQPAPGQAAPDGFAVPTPTIRQPEPFAPAPDAPQGTLPSAPPSK